MHANQAIATAADLRLLVDSCRQVLLKSSNDLVKVAAALLTADGQIFTALQVRSRNCNHCSVCAEAIAVGMALTAGRTDLLACVALVLTEHGIKVWSPCGSCRELLRDHGVAHIVVADNEDSGLVTAAVPDLLPWP